MFIKPHEIELVFCYDSKRCGERFWKHGNKLLAPTLNRPLITMRLHDWATLRKVNLKKPKVRGAYTKSNGKVVMMFLAKLSVIYGRKQAVFNSV